MCLPFCLWALCCCCLIQRASAMRYSKLNYYKPQTNDWHIKTQKSFLLCITIDFLCLNPF